MADDIAAFRIAAEQSFGGVGDAGAGDGAECGRRRHAELQHPGVHDGRRPIGVVPMGDAVLTPFRAPGIEHPKSFGVIADDREGMAAGRGAARLDALAVLQRLPMAMDLRRSVDYADIVERAVIVADVRLQPEIGAEPGVARFLGHVIGQRPWRLLRAVRRGRLAAHAVAEQALDGAAQAGALIGAAFPLVVALGHLVEHARADSLRPLGHAVAEPQIVDDMGQRIAGAAAVVALIAYWKGDARIDRGL